MNRQIVDRQNTKLLKNTYLYDTDTVCYNDNEKNNNNANE